MMLLRAREAIMVPFRDLLGEYGLTEQQWRVFRVLAKSDEIDVSQLSTATYLLGPSLARILRDLENQKLIATRTDKEDQRRKLIRLTPGGRARIELIAPLSEAIYDEITERFGADRMAALQHLLEELNGATTSSGWMRRAGDARIASSLLSGPLRFRPWLSEPQNKTEPSPKPRGNKRRTSRRTMEPASDPV